MASDYIDTNTEAPEAFATGQGDVRPRGPNPVRTALIVGLLAFLAGSVIMVWAFTQSDSARKLIGAAPVTEVSTSSKPAAVVTLPAPTTTAPAPVVSEAPAVDMRVSQLEERIARIDLRAAAAASNAGRAESLLVAFAARRAIDRGTGLGYVEGQLRARFGDTQPRAVSAIIAAAQNPVTIANLKQGLDRIAPGLTGSAKNEDWWTATRRTLSTLVVIRREGEAMPAPDERIARARLMIDGGQVDGALAEVARLPGQAAAGDWMTAARRWVEAHRALDIIEAAAIMPPPVEPVADAPVAAPLVVPVAPAL